MQSIIDGVADYTVGDGVEINDPILSIRVNRDNEDIEDIVKNAARDYAIYGGYALNIIRNKLGKICEIHNLDMKNIRSDKYNKMFYYSEDWSKSYGRVKYLQYPAFNPEDNVPSSILYVKSNKMTTYPIPLWASAVESAEIAKAITEFHLNSIKNGFASNIMINFNNGQPSDDVKEEIEETITEKFCGSENAGRPILSFNNDKDHQATIQRLDVADFSDRYESLAKWCRQELFTAFRSQPSLFGISTEGSQINKEDYNECFKLFNRTVIRPIQKSIVNTFKRMMFGDVLTIKPFTIDFDENNTNDENVKADE